MYQWLTQHNDAIALAVIVLLVLAGYAPLADSGGLFQVPDILSAGEKLLRSVTGVFVAVFRASSFFGTRPPTGAGAHRCCRLP